MSVPSVTSEGIWAWHFVQADGTTEYLKEAHQVGVLYRVEGPLELCQRGLHGSRRALDALRYAAGPVCQRTRHSGEILEGEDKLCSTERTMEWQIDATRLLHEFALEVAEEALRGAEVTDERCWTALAVKRRWLEGQATDEELDAARDAAWAAAGAAAKAAAWDAAWAAAKAAAKAAARAAAGAAAKAAAKAAARAAAWEKFNERLEALLEAHVPPDPGDNVVGE